MYVASSILCTLLPLGIYRYYYYYGLAIGWSFRIYEITEIFAVSCYLYVALINLFILLFIEGFT